MSFQRFLTVFALFFSSVTLAQVEMEDVILLKTAEVIRGEIRENVKGDYVSVLIGDTLLKTIEWEDIHLITEEVKRNRTRTTNEKTQRERVRPEGRRFGVILEPSFARTFNRDDDFSSLGVSLTPHINFKQKVFVGLHLGFRNILET